MNRPSQRQTNLDFLARLIARRPGTREYYESLLKPPMAEGLAAEAVPISPDAQLEAIVRRERPVLFVQDGSFNFEEVTELGPEANELVKMLHAAADKLKPALSLIGRIDVTHFPGSDYVGTGWFVDKDIVVTNRHVASLVAKRDGRKFIFSRGVGGLPIESSLCTGHGFNDPPPDPREVFPITEVLYIEPESGPNDIAFVRVKRELRGADPPFVLLASADVAENTPVCVVGYPARAPKRLIPDQDLMNQLYRGQYDVKRAAPGFTMAPERGSSRHDCTTLGGNSGSVVLDFSGRAVGLHFAGLYQQANYAVPVSKLKEYVSRKRWNQPIEIDTRPQAQTAEVAAAPSAAAVPVACVAPVVAVSERGTVSVTVPLTISLGLGAAGVSPGVAAVAATVAPVSAAKAEEAAALFWDTRPQGVLAVRVGYLDADDEIGDRPCIAVSVAPNRVATFESTAPSEFQGVPVRYFPAEIGEQLEAMPELEAIESVSYDDDARAGEKFSFSLVEEDMEVLLHVGPEYSWDVLHDFITGAKGKIVSAMYEFHAPHIMDALEDRLKAGASLRLVLDNATFSKVKDSSEEFDRLEVFDAWDRKYKFERIVAPEGAGGLIANSYHIKVTVREDDTFWLSSGNWKMGSSQPPITQQQRDNAADEDLPGNREWHVVIRNKTLAGRFRSHIVQDFKRSKDLGAGPLPPSLMEETFVDVPIEEAIVLERRPPSHILEPLNLHRSLRVRPLLTPDHEGEIYSEAVLELIRSARKSLLFQIPYIGMPTNPRQDRGYIDELIKALTLKLKSLEDARVILRAGGKQFSSPSHAAWFFKSKGVDIDERLRVIENHHTKGMIVDGKRVLLGSHNWSKPGVTLNRDASLVFDDKEVAAYYAEAFEIDWARATRARPRRFVKTEGAVSESTGFAPPPGYERVALSELLKDD